LLYHPASANSQQLPHSVLLLLLVTPACALPVTAGGTAQDGAPDGVDLWMHHWMLLGL
jgi:hypothetical protein